MVWFPTVTEILIFNDGPGIVDDADANVPGPCRCICRGDLSGAGHLREPRIPDPVVMDGIDFMREGLREFLEL